MAIISCFGFILSCGECIRRKGSTRYKKGYYLTKKYVLVFLWVRFIIVNEYLEQDNCGKYGQLFSDLENEELPQHISSY